jgi:hypothetical protein
LGGLLLWHPSEVAGGLLLLFPSEVAGGLLLALVSARTVGRKTAPIINIRATSANTLALILSFTSHLKPSLSIDICNACTDEHNFIAMMALYPRIDAGIFGVSALCSLLSLVVERSDF